MLFAMGPYRDFFRRKPYTEVAPPGLLEAPLEHAPTHLHGERWYGTGAARPPATGAISTCTLRDMSRQLALRLLLLPPRGE